MYNREVAENGRRHGKRQRDELALAAADWVIEHGLADLSLRRLAAGIGTSHRMLLYHFGSKDELFQAILRAARTREQERAATPPEDPKAPRDNLRRTWEYLSGPREHAFWRFYFEIHGLALQNPERYPDVLHEGVHDWLGTTRELVIGNGATPEHATAVATLIVGAFRGLMLDLLQTGERKRVDAGFEVLATITDSLATSASDSQARPRKRASTATARPGRRAS
jgi:AcrR family transcriptional regulator